MGGNRITAACIALALLGTACTAAESRGEEETLAESAERGTPTRDTPITEEKSETPAAEPAKRLARYPSECPGPAPVYKQSAPPRWVGPTVGEDPLFAGFYGYSPEHEAVRENAPRRRWGYRIKVLWIMPPDNEEMIEVTAENVETGEPVWFKTDYTHTTKPRFDPERESHLPEPEDRGWKSYGSYVYFTRAGCYDISARWTTGKWRLVLGFGSRR
jgi:hypothetical protein